MDERRELLSKQVEDFGRCGCRNCFFMLITKVIRKKRSFVYRLQEKFDFFSDNGEVIVIMIIGIFRIY